MSVMVYSSHDMGFHNYYTASNLVLKYRHMQSHYLPNVPTSLPGTVVMVKLFISFKPETDVYKV